MRKPGRTLALADFLRSLSEPRRILIPAHLHAGNALLRLPAPKDILLIQSIRFTTFKRVR